MILAKKPSAAKLLLKKIHKINPDNKGITKAKKVWQEQNSTFSKVVLSGFFMLNCWY